MISAGKVYLVGAGPGDPGLLTLRAKELLETCDTVVFDALVNPDILQYAPYSAERLFVGKRCGKISYKQAEINALLVERARMGERVVRLKGGDPFLFGRGGEEAEHLTNAGIAWEIVPGVSSALAAPATAGIPVTHRGLASSVAIVTAHEHGETGSPVNWAALATAADTLVVLMGASRLPELCAKIVAAGRAPETPAAVIESGTYAHQRIVNGPLAEIAELAREKEIGAPAILVVGSVAALGEHLYEGLRDSLSRIPQPFGIDGGLDWRWSERPGAASPSRRGDDPPNRSQPIPS